MIRVWFRALAVLGFLGLCVALLWTAAQSFAAAQERSREYHYLAEALDPVEPRVTMVRWNDPDRALVRSMTPGDETLVGTALTQAWRAFAAASDSGEVALLADHFVGIALTRASLAAEEAKRDGTRMVVLEQTARPEFLHLDGSVLQLTAEAKVVRFALRDGALAQYELMVDAVRTTLTNETTGWRIFSHERTGGRLLSAAVRAPVDLPRLRGVNYYPSNTPWSQFWPAFDRQVVAGDLDRVAALGGNAIRIFLPVADFGPDGDGARNLSKLRAILDLADERGIRVIPTLFDLKPGYRPAHWAEDVAYLRRVLPVLATAPAVVLVDLKNEPDLDRAAQGPGLVDAWLTTMALMAQEIAPDLPLTIGWSTAEEAGDLVSLVDAVSYHDYSDLAGTADRLDKVGRAAAGKPVLVTEIGESSFGLALGIPGSDAAQAEALQDRLSRLSAAEGVLVWTLHDFDRVDAAAVGGSWWVRRSQARFGLYDREGVPKPAGKVVAQAFAAP